VLYLTTTVPPATERLSTPGTCKSELLVVLPESTAREPRYVRAEASHHRGIYLCFTKPSTVPFRRPHSSPQVTRIRVLHMTWWQEHQDAVDVRLRQGMPIRDAALCIVSHQTVEWGGGVLRNHLRCLSETPVCPVRERQSSPPETAGW
jgi:hypothetical protein